MLNKLLKYEFKATARFFVPVYGIFAALLAMQRLSMLVVHWAEGYSLPFMDTIFNLFTGMISFVAVLAVIGLFVCPFLYSIIRFWKNMTGDEGYLTHTLPVTAGQNVLAKLLTACVWEIVSLLIALGCGLLYWLSIDAESITEAFRAFLQDWAKLDGDIRLWTVLFCVLVLVSAFFQFMQNLLAAYSAMSLGQSASKHKLLASGGVYIGFAVVSSTIVQVLSLAVLIGFGDNFMNTAMQTTNVLTAGLLFFKFMNSVLLLSIVLYALLCLLHFFLSRYFLTKKLNLA